VAGSFLSPGLSAASGNLASGLSLLRALSVVRKLLYNGKVEQVFIQETPKTASFKSILPTSTPFILKTDTLAIYVPPLLTRRLTR